MKMKVLCVGGVMDGQMVSVHVIQGRPQREIKFPLPLAYSEVAGMKEPTATEQLHAYRLESLATYASGGVPVRHFLYVKSDLELPIAIQMLISAYSEKRG